MVLCSVQGLFGNILGFFGLVLGLGVRASGSVRGSGYGRHSGISLALGRL